MAPRPPKLLIVLFTAFILLVVSAMQGLHTLDARRRAIAGAQQRAQNLAYMLAGYVRDNFAIADASLRQLVVHGRRVGGPDAADADWDPILAAAKASLAGSGSISVVDANGTVLHSTQHAIVGQSRRDDFVFKTLAAAGHDELAVDMPFLTPLAPRRYILPIGRRLTTAAGAFDGAVVATVLPDSFRDFFRTIDVGAQGAVWVFHPNGVVIFREPSSDDAINTPATSNAIFQAAMAATKSPGTGQLAGPVEPGGPAYFTAFARTDTPPLIVAVSYSEAEVLANWRHQVRSAVFAIGVLAMTLAAMMSVLFRQIDARTDAERELDTVQQTEAQRLRITNERLAVALEGEQRARRETEQASHLKDEFLMTVSHELRTPLTAIYGWARVLSAGGMPPDQQARAIEAVERNARAQAKLIDDLLDVSRAISGKLRIEPRAIAVAEVLQSAVETLAPAVHAKTIALQTSIDPAIGVALLDPDRLQQIAWNLLSNAIKFTPEGGSVSFAAAKRGAEIEIRVHDSGAGIAPEFLPHVFERFRQQEAGTRRRFGGLGLGLAIVRHLVELHGGTVAADSEGAGHGATFCVRLPVRAAAGTPPPETITPAPPAAADPPLSGLDVLVVDDEADARELLAAILTGAGARVSVAGSTAEAVRLLAAGGTDVLLSDIEMPGEDGYELLARIRDSGAARPGIAIALTAHARAADRQRALAAGFHAHVAKPIEPAELVALIASLIRV